MSLSLSLFFYCSGFCHTLKWNSHGFTCVPHPDPPSHLPLHPIPQGLPSAPGPTITISYHMSLILLMGPGASWGSSLSRWQQKCKKWRHFTSFILDQVCWSFIDMQTQWPSKSPGVGEKLHLPQKLQQSCLTNGVHTGRGEELGPLLKSSKPFIMCGFLKNILLEYSCFTMLC